MAPRRRSTGRRNWPDHLHERDGYFSWRDPVTGKEHGLGRNRAHAFAEAVAANVHLAGQRQRPALVDRLTGAATHSLGSWLDRYEQVLARRNLAENTRKSAKSLLVRARRDLDAGLPIRAVTPMMVTDACRTLEAEGKARLAQAFRSLLKDVFREAVVAGWVDENPVRATRLAQVKVKRARLTLEVFRQVYAADAPAWLRVAMGLAVVTAQRREDIALATFADFHDGGWWLTQKKTGTRLVLPLELRVEALELSLADVLAMARKTGVVSRFVVHQTRRAKGSTLGSAIFVDTISKQFTAAVAGGGVEGGDRTPPTFHEIRSLSERLYSLQGNVSTQTLLGHRDPRMTAVYNDVRGAEWVRVAIREGGTR